MKKISIVSLLLLLTSCAVGPEYKRPTTMVAEEYQESDINWKHAKPSADMDRGEWWKIFNDPILDDLIDKLNKNNQNIASAKATYKESLALVEKARAAYFPNISATNSVTSQKTNNSSALTEKNGKDISNHSVALDATWEADLWGSTKYSVASDLASAQANKAELASQTLSAQSSLAQYYFELRGLDINQKLLDSIVSANQKTLDYTKSNYKAGVIDETALLNAENALHNAKSNAYNNHTTRAQYQHAIAILIGESPSMFKLEPIKNHNNIAISIPVSIPSELLERRPDIAKAEELMKQANAQIGIAKTAFFPSMGISSNFTMSGDGLGNLLSMPNFIWSVGPQAALGLFDGGARAAQSSSAWAAYEASVASYRQIVLSAFGEVEDQLVSLKNLDKQSQALNKAAINNKHILDISLKQYKSGIIDHSQVLNNQINYYNAQKSAIDMESLKRSAEIGLVKALGGGWTSKNL